MMPLPETIYLYRMVHWQNVDYLLRTGICCREHPQADPDYINIGHRQLIVDRHEHSIPLLNAGQLGEYIPFYFAGHSPMLYLIKNGYQGVLQRPQEDIVFLVTTFDTIISAGLEYVFTDRNAKIAIAGFYNKEADLEKIKWDIVESKVWKNDQSNISRQDYKQAEFLVRHYLPSHCIQAIVVKTEERKAFFEAIVENLGLQIRVHLDNNRTLYY